jgi:hypothetical protein
LGEILASRVSHVDCLFGLKCFDLGYSLSIVDIISVSSEMGMRLGSGEFIAVLNMLVAKDCQE